MREECQNICTRAIIALDGTPLLQTIKDFLGNSKEIPPKQALIARFYDYISKKHQIACEPGMLFVERVVTLRMFDLIRQAEDPHNTLVNAKVALYAWLKPAHLKIPLEIPDGTVAAFQVIEASTVPTVKTNAYMSALDGLYKVLGRDGGHDTLFPALVYCLIKSQVSDLVVHFRFMKALHRRYLGRCMPGCTHGFETSIRCDCLHRQDWHGEEEYYLVTALAAIEFIRKIEYYSLSVSVAEFNSEISERLKSMSFADEKRIK